MDWLALILAGLMETAWVIGLKHTAGFTQLLPSALTIGAMVVSLGLLSYAVETLPLGTAYAVWTGIGTVGAVAAGIVLYHDSVQWLRLVCMALILAGIGGLRLTDSGGGL
jgi:quaternary ammonium compound-resistance protein SugE